MRTHRSVMVLAAAALVGSGSPAAQAYQRPARLERVSVADDGRQAEGWSPYSSISADGRFVAFYSTASNIVPGDTNGQGDIFVRDRLAGRTVRVSVASDRTQSNGDSFGATISADGRTVAFASFATALAPGAFPGQVFVHDLQTRTTELVSVSSDESAANCYASAPAISADGRYVSFESCANNLVPGDTNTPPSPLPPENDIFVRDRLAGTTHLVSVASDGTQANGHSQYPSISGDGRYVAFQSTASNLVPGDTNVAADPLFRTDVFLHDRATGLTERVNLTSNGEQAAGHGGFPAVSYDGRYVAFVGTASNMVPNDANRVLDVFVRDRVEGVTDRVSVAGTGAEGTNSSLAPSISADGRFVAFGSDAPNLVPGDTNSSHDAFLHDRLTRETVRLSVGEDGRQGSGQSITPKLTPDARFVSFGAYGALVDGDTNNNFDVHVLERGPHVGVGRLEVTRDGTTVRIAGAAGFGGVVATSGGDAADDVVADAAGADLTRAAIAYRVESEDLLLSWDVTRLPSTGTVVWTQPGYAPLPIFEYSMSFTYKGTRYRVDAVRADARGGAVHAPSFTLSTCAPACQVTTALEGGYGTTGNRVHAAVRMATIGGDGGTVSEGIAEIRARSTSVAVDSIALPPTAPLAPRVWVGVAQREAGSPPDSSLIEIPLDRGRFSGTIDVSSLPPGPYDVVVRTCAADLCTLERRALDI